MLRITLLSIVMCVASASIGATEKVSAEKAQSEIRYVGYECERVDDIQPSASGSELTVTCDRIYRFTIRYERGGVTVEVIS